MNERLEEIKEMNGVINHKNPAWQEEIDWLINRVEELEEHKKLALELEEAYQLTKDLNQRYKLALELIHKDTFYESEHDLISPIHVIRKRVEKVLGESE